MYRVLLVALAVAGCGGGDFRDCSEEQTPFTERLPASILNAGLYQDLEASELAPDVIEFEPRFPLWTDGAHKRRWLLLPPGGVVDTTDEDNWVFPVGTRAFKEFERDGTTVETRMVERFEEGWAGVAYIWNPEKTDALAAPDGALDASGTTHDVPNERECFACHGGRSSFILGFSAIQLAPDVRSSLADSGILSVASGSEPDLSDIEMAGLGVLHGNCSHCHNPMRGDNPQATGCFEPNNPFDFSLPVGTSRIDSAPAVVTAAKPLGKPSNSKVLKAMEDRNQSGWTPSMPPLGTELGDFEGAEAVRALIVELQ